MLAETRTTIAGLQAISAGVTKLPQHIDSLVSRPDVLRLLADIVSNARLNRGSTRPTDDMSVCRPV